MISTQSSFNIHKFTDFIFRRILYVIIPFIFITAGVVVYLILTPKYYKASTTVLVTPQKVPENFVRPTITATIQDRLQTLSQEILSRTRLEQLINEFKLYPEEVRSWSMEQVVEMMRKNIQFDIKAANQGRRDSSAGGHFNITFTGKNPAVVTQVTNKLSSLFIEENLRYREQQAQGTVEFLDNELKVTKDNLDKQEGVLTEFKKRFMNELPEQRDTNIRVLEQLQMNNQRIGESLKAAEDRKLSMQNKLADLEMGGTSSIYLDELRAGRGSPTAPVPRLISPQEHQLNMLKAQLAELEAKYKPNHPDILIIKKKISDLEGSIKGKVAQKEKGGKDEDGRTSIYYEAMKKELPAIDREIQRLRAEETKLKGMIADYRFRIEKTPIREITLGQIMQDYNQAKEAYQNLLKKREEAQQAENLERRQKGEQFKVIDPARLPDRPFKPNVMAVIFIGLLIGLGAGLGMAFMVEQMDRSFRDAEDLEVTLGLRVLANIPRVEKRAA